MKCRSIHLTAKFIENNRCEKQNHVSQMVKPESQVSWIIDTSNSILCEDDATSIVVLLLKLLENVNIIAGIQQYWLLWLLKKCNSGE